MLQLTRWHLSESDLHPAEETRKKRLQLDEDYDLGRGVARAEGGLLKLGRALPNAQMLLTAIEDFVWLLLSFRLLDLCALFVVSSGGLGVVVVLHCLSQGRGGGELPSRPTAVANPCHYSRMQPVLEGSSALEGGKVVGCSGSSTRAVDGKNDDQSILSAFAVACRHRLQICGVALQCSPCRGLTARGELEQFCGASFCLEHWSFQLAADPTPSLHSVSPCTASDKQRVWHSHSHIHSHAYMHVCILTFIHAFIRPSIHSFHGSHIQAYTHRDMHIDMDTHAQTHRYTDTQTHRHTHAHTRTHTHTHAHTRTHTHTHAHTRTHTHTHAHTRTHRHTDTQTHRHTDTQTHRHTDTQTHRHTHTHTKCGCDVGLLRAM